MIRILLIAILLPIGLMSQPSNVILIDCDSTKYNGPYTYLSVGTGGGPCYTLDSDNTKTLELDLINGWKLGTYLTGSSRCTSAPIISNDFSNDTNTDVTLVTALPSPVGMCGIAASAILPPTKIPTMGEWGILILMLLLSTISIVGIKHRVIQTHSEPIS